MKTEEIDSVLASLTSHVRETEGSGKALAFFVDYIQPIKKYFEGNEELVTPLVATNLRVANSSDIVVGNTVYVWGDDKKFHEKKIDEVIRPSDDWKAFVGDDGCRYGLVDLYVTKIK